MSATTRHQPARLHFAVTLLCAYVLLVLTAFVVNLPGRVDQDSLAILFQAHNLAALNNWHSPFITFVYGFFWPVMGAPAGALLVQCVLLMAWPALILAAILESRARYIPKTALLLVWLAVVATLVALAGGVKKDVLGLSFLSMLFFTLAIGPRGCGLVRSESRLAGWVTLWAICATLIRPTNLLILLICVGAFLAYSWRNRAWRGSASKAATLVVLALLATLANRPLFGAREAYPQDTPIVFDLAGISSYTHINLFEKLGSDAPSQPPWACYSPKSSNTFFWGNCKQYGEFVQRHQKRLLSLWVSAIFHHPLAYLDHRAHFAWQFLVANQPQIRMPAPPGFFTNTVNYGRFITEVAPAARQVGMWHPTIAYAPFGMIAYLAFHSPLGQPLLWVFVLLLAGAAAHRYRRCREGTLLTMLAALGLSNVVVMVFVSPVDVVRYLLPTWLCAVGSCATLTVLLLRRGAVSAPQQLQAGTAPVRLSRYPHT